MSGFIEWLENLGKKDRKVRAVLRRSLAFDPGTYVAAYPYVESFVKGEENAYRRWAMYLVAGLWAAHWCEARVGGKMSVGSACAYYKNASKSSSVENRFIVVLDADHDQLAHRLRQMIALLKEYPIDFDALLKGIIYWDDDMKRTQNAWARDFYRHVESEKETTTKKEKN